MLRGLGTKDLAFLAGRHLTYYRREHYALVHYPTLPELSALFLAAVKIAMPAVPVPTQLSDVVGTMRKALLRQIGATRRRSSWPRGRAPRRARRAGGSRGVDPQRRADGPARGAGAVRGPADRDDADAGGDRAIAELTLDQKRADLLAYCASERLAKARALLGADGRTSAIPPPEEGIAAQTAGG